MKKATIISASVSIILAIYAFNLAEQAGNGLFWALFNAAIFGGIPFAFAYILKHLRD